MRIAGIGRKITSRTQIDHQIKCGWVLLLFAMAYFDSPIGIAQVNGTAQLVDAPAQDGQSGLELRARMDGYGKCEQSGFYRKVRLPISPRVQDQLLMRTWPRGEL